MCGISKKQIISHPWTASGLELGNCPCSPRLGGAPRSWSSKHRGQSSPVHVRPLTEWLGVYSTCFPVCKTVLLGLVSQGCSGISQPMWGKCDIVNACILESPSELSAHSFDYPQWWEIFVLWGWIWFLEQPKVIRSQDWGPRWVIKLDDTIWGQEQGMIIR